MYGDRESYSSTAHERVERPDGSGFLMNDVSTYKRTHVACVRPDPRRSGKIEGLSRREGRSGAMRGTLQAAGVSRVLDRPSRVQELSRELSEDGSKWLITYRLQDRSLHTIEKRRLRSSSEGNGM